MKLLVFSLDTFGIVFVVGAASLDLIQNDSGFYEIGLIQKIIILIGLLITLGSNFLIRPTSIWKTSLTTKFPASAVFCISVLLLVINLIGLAFPLRNPAVYEGLEYAGKIRTPQYSSEEVFARMDRDASIDEQYPEYVKRLNKLIFDGTVHYWVEFEDSNAYNLRIPIHENWLIYFSRILLGERDNYEFCRAERAIERSTCVCSQSSKILADILGRNRIPAHIVGLEGHVVTRARVDKETDQWWILDADYGVVLEHDIDAIEANPEIVQAAYEDQGYSQRVINTLIEIYGPEGNFIIDENHQCGEEDHLYLLKWLLPILGFWPFATFIVVYQFRKPEH